MGGRFYLVGFAVVVLQGAFRRGAACSLNNTGSQILKNVVSLFMVFGFCHQTVGTVDLLRSDPGTGSAPFSVHFHWSDVTVAQAWGGPREPPTAVPPHCYRNSSHFQLMEGQSWQLSLQKLWNTDDCGISENENMSVLEGTLVAKPLV